MLSVNKENEHHIVVVADLGHRNTRVIHFVSPSRQAKTVDRDGILSELVILVALAKSCQVYMLEWSNSKSDMLRCNCCRTDK